MHHRVGNGGRACYRSPLGCPFHELFSPSSRKNCTKVRWTWPKSLGITQSTYVVAAKLLLLVELRVGLVDTRPKVGRVTAEGHVQILQEGVATRKQRLRLVGVRIDTRLAVKDDDTVGEISSHDEIVLDDKGRLLGMHDKPLNNTAGHDTLFGIKV